MPLDELVYDVMIEAPDSQIRVDWGHEPGWMQTYKFLLARAERISLVPKDGVNLPVVSTQLGDGKRWIIFSRVYGALTGTAKIRLYALGWQTTVGGVNVKAIMWVYPDSSIECGEEPTYWGRFL